MYEGQTIGIGIGSTDALSLRVSVASLARVVFEDPGDGYTLLALERKATLHPTEGRVAIKAQPFGGALRIENLLPLKERIGDFHFDSQRSRSDGDFRIYIRPADWGAVRAFCLEQYGRPDGSALEPGPERELVEEFGDILGVDLSPNQYRCTPLWTVLENQPAPTGNIRAENQLTVRLYRVFVVRVTDSDLVKTMISNSERYSDRALGELAREDARQGGKGWANAMLVTPLEALTSFYRTLPEDRRNLPAIYKGFHLEPNVTALLEGVMAPKYQRV
jgi:hypothetical protein